MKVRSPAVAGRYYPRNKYDLIAIIKDVKKKEEVNIKKDLPVKNIIGGIVPHAGYEYSAYEAIHFFEMLRISKQKFDTIVILHPNHTGYGPDISIDENEYWETPIGRVPIDIEFQQLLDLEPSIDAHKYEHSGEVIIPFLQVLLGYPYMIVPIAFQNQTIENAKRIAAIIYEANKKTKRKLLLIASSDFSHFVSPEEGISQDNFAIEKILQFESEELEKVVKKKKISLCGNTPIMALLEYAQIISENPKIELLARGNSSKRYPSMEVVDYISFLVYE